MMLHDTLSSLVIALCLWAIVSPRVPTGVLGSAGLGAVTLAALWSLDEFHDPFVALDLALAGVALIGAGMAWRLLRHRQPHMRRVADWHPGWAQTQPREIEPDLHSRIAGGKGQS